MADINVERKEGRSVWPWIIGLLLLALIVWGLTQCSDDGAEQTVVPADTLQMTEPLDTAGLAPVPMSPDTGM